MILSVSPFLASLSVLFVLIPECSFCWWRRTKSLLAKQRPHAAHWNGFSLVCDLSWRFKCSSLANPRVHVVQMWGLGLSVLIIALFLGIGSKPWTLCWTILGFFFSGPPTTTSCIDMTVIWELSMGCAVVQWSILELHLSEANRYNNTGLPMRLTTFCLLLFWQTKIHEKNTKTLHSGTNVGKSDVSSV